MNAFVEYWAWCMGAFALGAVGAAIAVTMLVPSRTARQAVQLLTEDTRAALATGEAAAADPRVGRVDIVDPRAAALMGARDERLGEIALGEAVHEDVPVPTDPVSRPRSLTDDDDEGWRG